MIRLDLNKTLKYFLLTFSFMFIMKSCINHVYVFNNEKIIIDKKFHKRKSLFINDLELKRKKHKYKFGYFRPHSFYYKNKTISVRAIKYNVFSKSYLSCILLTQPFKIGDIDMSKYSSVSILISDFGKPDTIFSTENTKVYKYQNATFRYFNGKLNEINIYINNNAHGPSLNVFKTTLPILKRF